MDGLSWERSKNVRDLTDPGPRVSAGTVGIIVSAGVQRGSRGVEEERIKQGGSDARTERNRCWNRS